jgi:hypothetical protein
MKEIFMNTALRALPFLFIFVLPLSPLAGQVASADSTADVMIQDLRELANQDRARAQAWWYTWLGGYSAATAGQGIVYFTSEDKSLRQDMALGAATTFLGAVGQLLTPMLPKDATYGRPTGGYNAAGAEPLSYEQSAELLKALALREKEGRSWKVHAVAGAVNIGSGLITWLGFKRTFLDGLGNFALNTVITEAQIWTQPTRAIRDYERYYREQGMTGNQGIAKPESEWTVNVYPGGFSVRFDF